MKNHPQQHLIALGIQQPWAELILRGIKTIEIRNVPVGMRAKIYLYSSRKLSSLPDAQEAIQAYSIDVTDLPQGQVVGTIEIADCRPSLPEDSTSACVSPSLLTGRFSWRLQNPERLEPPLTPKYIPYGMWFYPFQRRDQNK